MEANFSSVVIPENEPLLLSYPRLFLLTLPLHFSALSPSIRLALLSYLSTVRGFFDSCII